MSDVVTRQTKLVMGSQLLSDSDAVVVKLAPGATVTDLAACNRHPGWEADTELCAAANGAPVDGTYVVQEGDCITLAPSYQVSALIAIGIFLLKAIAFAIISYGLSLLINKWFGPDDPSTNTDEDAGKPTYGWNGPRTLYTQGQPAPIVFGEFQTGGSVISYFITQDGAKSYLNLLVYVSDSEIKAIGGVDRALDGVTGASIPPDIWIGGRRLNTYRRVQVWTRLGTTNQRPIPGFNDRVLQFPMDQPLKVGKQNSVSYTTRLKVDTVSLRVKFPDGLIEQAGSRGKMFPVRVDHKFRHRVVNDNGTFGNWSGWIAWNMLHKSTTGFTREKDFKVPSRERYEFEMYRSSARISSEAGRDKSEWESVVEIQYRDFSYPRGAMFAVKALATAGLNTNRPQIRVGYQGTLVDVWTGTEYVRQYSANPWWCVLWMARDTDRGLGSEFRNMQLPLADFKTAADEADALVHAGVQSNVNATAVAGTNRVPVASTVAFIADDVVFLDKDGTRDDGPHTIQEIDGLVLVLKTNLTSTHTATQADTVATYHEKFRFDGQFDENGNCWDAMQTMAKTARGTVIKLGNRLVLKRATISEPMLVVNEGNCRNVQLTYVNPRTQANEWRAQFIRENFEGLYESDTLVVQDRDAIIADASEDDYYARTVRIAEDVQLIGVKRAAQVRRDLKFRQRMTSNSDTVLTFEIPIEGIGTFPGAVFAFAHHLVGLGINGRITAAVTGAGTSFTADREVVLEAATTYQLLLRADDDTLGEFTITSGAGTYAIGDSISISGTFVKASAKHAPYIVGPLLAGPVVEYEITNWKFKPDMWLQIEAINYSDDTYTDPDYAA